MEISKKLKYRNPETGARVYIISIDDENRTVLVKYPHKDLKYSFDRFRALFEVVES
jgi:hypothetical protein